MKTPGLAVGSAGLAIDTPLCALLVASFPLLGALMSNEVDGGETCH
jgi:hypothetical protein